MCSSVVSLFQVSSDINDINISKKSENLLLNLSEDLYNQVIRSYRDNFLHKQIKDKYDQRLILMKSHFNFIVNLNYDVDIEDFIDVGEFHLFYRLLRQYNKTTSYYFAYIYKSITGFIEYYYSLDFYKRKEIYDYIVKDSQDPLNDKNVNSRVDELLFCKFRHIIDPDNLHSGASYGWCARNMLPMIIGKYNDKFYEWIALIEGHF